MKIFDFALDGDFNNLRIELSSAPLVDYFRDQVVPKVVIKIDLPPVAPSKPLDLAPKTPLPVMYPARAPSGNAPAPTTTVQADVDFDDVEVVLDGTLRYKGQRVIFYIYDINGYQNDFKLPRYHIADCATRQAMRTLDRSSRFITSNRQDGLFPVRVNGRQIPGQKLLVCQHCLRLINWNGFGMHMTSDERAVLVSSFVVKDYFSKYR
jgi:hypothetical protein